MGLRALNWTIWSMVIATLVISGKTRSTTSAQTLPKKSSDDSYTDALHKALLFFNAQKSGRLPKDNGIPWRGDSGVDDGSLLKDVKGGLAGGYYDSGENTKFHFPMAFSITMLSWSLIEYPHKYHAVNEYNHIRELIKWGSDYLLQTFDTTTLKIDKIYTQVGGASKNSSIPNDMNCWQRPEDMDYPRPVQTAHAGPELAAEMAAALAAASIVFYDNPKYSNTLLRGAEPLFIFARDRTTLHICQRSQSIPSQPLQYVVTAAFLANLYADYLYAIETPGWFCGTNFYTANTLRDFETPCMLNTDRLHFGEEPSEVKLCGWIRQKSTQTECTIHRAASIPSNGKRYSCKGGYKWRNSKEANPNTIVGAMVGGPDPLDRFHDDRTDGGSSEPTLAGNAGLVAALVSLTSSGGRGVDNYFMFSIIPPLCRKP